jgi:hypothetical protein
MVTFYCQERELTGIVYSIYCALSSSDLLGESLSREGIETIFSQGEFLRRHGSPAPDFCQRGRPGFLSHRGQGLVYSRAFSFSIFSPWLYIALALFAPFSCPSFSPEDVFVRRKGPSRGLEARRPGALRFWLRRQG